MQAPRQCKRGMMGRFLVLTILSTWIVVGCKPSRPDLAWQRIQEQGVLRIGMDANWVPFEYIDGSGQLSGFDVDLARELGSRLGLKVEFVANLSFDGLYDALTAGRADAIISALVVERERSSDFMYSTPYFDAGQVIVVGADRAGIDGMEDLARRVLAVELGSAGDAVARRWARRLTDLVLVHVDSADDALSAVASGQADAALTDRATALMALREVSVAGLRIDGEPVTGEQYAIAVRRGVDGLLRALNAALADMQQDGTLQELEREWLGP